LALRFAPVGKGLYACTNLLKNDTSGWALINTVEDLQKEYTKQEYQDAVLARKVQNIIMFPGVQEYMKIEDSKYIDNCPVGRAGIAVAAERIFRTNLGALKGKTIYQPGIPVSGRIDGVPPSILELYQKVTLSIDIVFVNKIPFLLTIARGLCFGTVENLTDHKVPMVTAALKRVLQLYRRRGFRVVMVNAEQEFAPLNEIFENVSFNFCSQDEAARARH
jgi:hypothetical protein